MNDIIIKCLIVEDTEAIITAIENIIKYKTENIENVKVVIDITSSAEDAVQNVTNKNYDVVTIDYELSVGSGDDVANAILSKYKNTKKYPFTLFFTEFSKELSEKVKEHDGDKFVIVDKVNFDYLKDVLEQQLQVIINKFKENNDKIIGPRYHELNMEEYFTKNISLLIIGEPGSGKENFARNIHHLYQKENKVTGPFYLINCANFTQHTVMHELLGHVQGAIPGVTNDHLGIFLKASGFHFGKPEGLEGELPFLSKLNGGCSFEKNLDGNYYYLNDSHSSGTIYFSEIQKLPKIGKDILLNILDSKLSRPLGWDDIPFKISARIIASFSEPDTSTYFYRQLNRITLPVQLIALSGFHPDYLKEIMNSLLIEAIGEFKLRSDLVIENSAYGHIIKYIVSDSKICNFNELKWVIFKSALITDLSHYPNINITAIEKAMQISVNALKTNENPFFDIGVNSLVEIITNILTYMLRTIRIDYISKEDMLRDIISDSLSRKINVSMSGSKKNLYPNGFEQLISVIVRKIGGYVESNADELYVNILTKIIFNTLVLMLELNENISNKDLDNSFGSKTGSYNSRKNSNKKELEKQPDDLIRRILTNYDFGSFKQYLPDRVKNLLIS